MIGIDFDQIFAEIKRIQRDMKQFPAASDVARSEGGTTSATARFRHAVDRLADGMGTVTTNSISALNDANEAIRLAVMEIAEQDAAVADETNVILSLLDSAVKQAPPQPTDTAVQQPSESSNKPDGVDF